MLYNYHRWKRWVSQPATDLFGPHSLSSADGVDNVSFQHYMSYVQNL